MDITQLHSGAGTSGTVKAGQPLVGARLESQLEARRGAAGAGTPLGAAGENFPAAAVVRCLVAVGWTWGAVGLAIVAVAEAVGRAVAAGKGRKSAAGLGRQSAAGLGMIVEAGLGMTVEVGTPVATAAVGWATQAAGLAMDCSIRQRCQQGAQSPTCCLSSLHACSLGCHEWLCSAGQSSCHQLKMPVVGGPGKQQKRAERVLCGRQRTSYAMRRTHMH